VKYRYKTKPEKYQVRALKKMLGESGRTGCGALWMPMRSGKSKVAVDWASVLHLKYGVRRVLVLTHTVTTFGVWKNEFRKHCPLAYTLEVQEEPKRLKGKGLEVMVLNIQQVFSRDFWTERDDEGNITDRGWTVEKNEWLRDWDPEAIIVDESTCIGDPSATQTAHLYRLVKDLGVRFILELTGTPVHRKIWGAFGQFKVLDDSVFGTAITVYRTTYGIWGGYGGRKLIKLRNIKKWRRKVEPYVFQMRRLPFRRPREIVIPVELSPKSWAVYDEMEKEAVASVGQTRVLAPVVVTKILKCCQIAAGWLRDTETAQWHRVGTELRDAFADTVRGLSESEVNRIVVFARHIPELRDAALACKEAGYSTLLLHGGVSAAGREQRIARFHDPGGKIAFISQIATGSMGIDLSAADTALYYTLTESLLHKDQADARIRRRKETRALTYYYFIPRHTHLETMLLALREKMNMVEYVTKHPDIIHHEETA
jgi:superfamily II DNA or RNA helicase